jgi:FkbM family methyltransferase
VVGSQGEVISVEPLIRNLVCLYHHTLLNKATNVSIIPTACSDSLSLAAFSLGPNFATGSLANLRHEENSSERALFLVPTVTVDAIVQRLGTCPDVIEVDVEGAELSVLKGAQVTLREAKPRVLLSVHSEALRSNCLEFLTKLGYRFEVLNRNKDNPSEFLAK